MLSEELVHAEPADDFADKPLGLLKTYQAVQAGVGIVGRVRGLIEPFKARCIHGKIPTRPLESHPVGKHVFIGFSTRLHR